MRTYKDVILISQFLIYVTYISLTIVFIQIMLDFSENGYSNNFLMKFLQFKCTFYLPIK